MAYQKYQQKIVIPYQVQLVGHPFKTTTGSVPFKDPGSLNTMVDLRTLRSVLKSKQCYWARISSAEAEAANKELHALQVGGGKPQRNNGKQGANANIKRGPNKRTRDNKENDDLSMSVSKSKKTKAAKKGKVTAAAGKARAKEKRRHRASTSRDAANDDGSGSSGQED